MTTGQRSTPERVIFAAAAAILLAIAGSIVWLWLQDRDPAIVTVEQVGVARAEGSQTYVTGSVHNDGDETAEAVQVTAELTVDGEVAAEGEQSIDFLSGGETQEIVFIFEAVESEGEIEMRVASYTIP